jgi:hypothetical protein
MTSEARQDAREKAGILKGKNHGYEYGTTSRHVRFDAEEKESYGSEETQDHDALIGWDDLCEFDPAPHSVGTLSGID